MVKHKLYILGDTRPNILCLPYALAKICLANVNVKFMCEGNHTGEVDWRSYKLVNVKVEGKYCRCDSIVDT